MRVKHFFYLLLALPLVFTACDKGSEDVDKAPEKEAVLTLTSEATLEFEAEGGEGEICYTATMEEVTRNSPVPEPEVEATCAAEWVTIDAVDFEKTTFTVAANEGEARETKIVVKYDTKSFEVAVKQAAKEQGEEPEDPENPEEPKNVEAKSLVGEYYGFDEEYGSDVYYVILSDEVVDFEAEEFVNGASYYNLALFAPKYEGEWSETVSLPVGEYTFDMEGVGTANTISGVESFFLVYDESNPEAEPSLYDAAKLVVAETGITLTATIAGEEHVVTFAGEQLIYNCTEPAGAGSIEAVMTSARRIGTAEFGYEVYSYDFPIVFEGEEYSALVYFVGDEEDTVLQAGEYINSDYSIYIVACAFGNDEVEYELATASASVAVEGDVYSFDVTMVDVDGVVLHFTYEGEVEDMNPANNEPEAFVPAKVVASRDATYPAGNFFLQLYVDDYRYHDIEMYDKVNPNENYLSSGKYTLADGTIGDWSTFSNGVNTNCEVSDAEITLVNNSDNSVTLVGFIKSVEGHYITIDWTGTVEGFNFETGGDNVSFTAQYFTCEYIEYDGVHNYWVTLSDAAEDDVLGAAYYSFDLYSATLDTDNPRVPVGTYAFDIEDSYADGTMGVSYTYMEMKTTDGVVVWLGSEGGTLTVTETGIEATINYDDGSTHTITYTGDLSIELPEPEPISSLTADVAVNVTNATIVTSTCYGDIYGTGAQYWLINIMEDATYGNGVYVQLDLLATSNESYVGTYTASNQFGAGTFTPGIVGDYGNASSWYYHQQYYVKDTWAPLADGTITVTDNGDGTKSFTFDCTDGLGHAVKGTIVAR